MTNEPSVPATFPFGQPLRRVVQKPGAPKEAFILGVYASAVHARWIGPHGKVLVKALAVDSEPEIFWRGDDAPMIISKIMVPEGAGRLVAPNEGHNGPSGQALDNCFLKPLGLNRDQVWLCDLLPESRMNPAQKKALDKTYNKMTKQLGLPSVTIPPFDKNKTCDDGRRKEICDELRRSGAKKLILLGDQPIKQFLRPMSDIKAKDLDAFTKLAGGYGKGVKAKVCDVEIEVVGLCHPRQAAQLGRNSRKWHEMHKLWLTELGVSAKC